jgi:hypothetical protein
VESEEQQRRSRKNTMEKEDREYAIALLMREEQELLEKEKEREEMMQVLQQETMLSCSQCSRDDLDLNSMYYLEACTHMFCIDCLKAFVSTKLDQKKPNEITCFTCYKPFLPADFRELLSEKELDIYLNLCNEELFESSSIFMKCPKCTYVIEKMSNINSPDNEKLDRIVGITGKPISETALQHRNMFRFRCRNCETEFCSECKLVPYHLGFGCDEFREHLQSLRCRFCQTSLTDKNQAPPTNDESVNLVCNAQDCLEKRDLACRKSHSCGHLCGGVKDEVHCPPCLDEECSKNAVQTGDDFCNICWVDTIAAAPSIKLNCGHFFHLSCTLKKISSGWPGARITFGYLDCPLCNSPIQHELLEQCLRDHLKLKKLVETKSVERLEYMGLKNCKELTDEDSQFFNNPSKYALFRFSYFPCFKCKEPYFGGERACEGNQPEFNPEELVCGGCSAVGQTECKKHGMEFIEYKCKFCCSVAVWFCWGNTHFCDECHTKSQTVPKIPRNELPKCHCGIPHPLNGEEFCLGCSVCRFESMAIRSERQK